MAPRISSKEAKEMYDAYHKVYAPKEEPVETEASAEEPAEEESE